MRKQKQMDIADWARKKMFTMTDHFLRNCNNWDITDITVAICKNNKNNNTSSYSLYGLNRQYWRLWSTALLLYGCSSLSEQNIKRKTKTDRLAYFQFPRLVQYYFITHLRRNKTRWCAYRPPIRYHQHHKERVIENQIHSWKKWSVQSMSCRKKIKLLWTA